MIVISGCKNIIPVTTRCGTGHNIKAIGRQIIGGIKRLGFPARFITTKARRVTKKEPLLNANCKVQILKCKMEERKESPLSLTLHFAICTLHFEIFNPPNSFSFDPLAFWVNGFDTSPNRFAISQNRLAISFNRLVTSFDRFETSFDQLALSNHRLDPSNDPFGLSRSKKELGMT